MPKSKRKTGKKQTQFVVVIELLDIVAFPQVNIIKRSFPGPTIAYILIQIYNLVAAG